MSAALHLARPEHLDKVLALVTAFHAETGIASSEEDRRAGVEPLLEGHPYGAIAGGFVVGFAETLAVFNWGILLRPFRDSLPEWLSLPGNLAFVGTEYKIVVPFFILVAILVWRPTGIFKGKVI